MRTTLLGGPARRRPPQPRPRRARRGAVRVRPRLPARAGAGPGRPRRRAASPARSRRPRASHTGSRRWRSACSPASWALAAPRRREPTSTTLKGVLEVLAAPARSAARDRRPRASRSCTRARAAAVELAGAPAGWLGELHPLVARAWDLDPAGPPSSSTWRRCSQAAGAGAERYEDVTTLPGRVPGHGGHGARGRARARRGRERSARRAAPLLRRGALVRPLPRRAGRRGRARASRCGSSSGRPTGR